MDLDNIFDGLKENKKTFVWVLILVIIVIILSILNLFFDNKNERIDVDGVVESFAGIYYEEYYYPEIISLYGDDYAQKLKDDEKNGIKLTLRKIVSTFQDVAADKFYQEGNYCDFVDTYALIFPKFSYGINDYEIKVVTSCEKN